jgi:taurine dioxygenase
MLPESASGGRVEREGAPSVAHNASSAAMHGVLPRTQRPAMSSRAIEPLGIVPLSRHIGAEIRGIDLRQKPDETTLRAVYAAWLEHLVVVFPGQSLSQEDLLRVTGYFGELSELSRPAKYFPKGYSRLLPGIMLISNIRENGEPIGALPDGEMMFHHDMIHAEVPSKATLLYAVEIPSVGGNTLFASGYAAYDTLQSGLRQSLEGRLAVHHYNYGSTQKGDGRGTAAFAECVHPVFRTHEETGRKAIYVNRLMTVGIVDMEQTRSEALLNTVFDHAEQPEFVYEHVWRAGDLLLWDNRCSSHARTDFPATERRLMLRTTVKGTIRPV